MLAAFGTDLAFMDATYGLNSYGFIQVTLVVRDEFGNGVPVAACISSAENAAVFQEFLEAVIEVRAAAAEWLLGGCWAPVWGSRGQGVHGLGLSAVFARCD